MPQPLTLPPELQRKKAAKEKYAPLVMVGLLAGSALVIVGLPTPHKGGLLGFGLLFWLGLLVSIPSYIGFIWSDMAVDDQIKLCEKSMRAKMQTKAEQRWLEMFYCGRCDGVFMPGEGRFVPIGEMRTYLYQ